MTTKNPSALPKAPVVDFSKPASKPAEPKQEEKPVSAATRATNHLRAIITISSKEIQLAQSKGKPGQYFKKGKSGSTVAKDNHIETCKCSPTQSCTRTKVGNHLIVHNESKIGFPFLEYPSWYDSEAEMMGQPPNGVGFLGNEVQFFARAHTKSPDVMVEGKWLVREHDEAELDNKNYSYGQFVYKEALTQVPDDSDLVFAQCGVEKLKIECGHVPGAGEEGAGGGGEGGKSEGGKSEGGKSEGAKEKRYVMMGVDPKAPHAGARLECFIGDTITITAFRLNAAETDPLKRSETRCDFAYYKEKRGPLPEGETQHAAFTIVRNKHVMIPAVTPGWAEKTETKVGKNTKAKAEDDLVESNVSILTLADDWLLKEKKSEEDKKKEKQPGLRLDKDGQDEALDKRIEQREAASRTSARDQVKAGSALGDASAERSRNRSKQANADFQSAGKKYESAVDKHAADREALEKAENKKRDARVTAFFVDSYKTLTQIIDWQPLILTINSHGCSKGPVGIIHAYPKGEASVNLWTLTDWPLKVAFDKIKNGIAKISGWLKQIKGTSVKGHGVPDEAPTASVEAAGFVIGFYFMQRSSKHQDDIKGKTERVDDRPRDANDYEPLFKLGTEWKELARDSAGPDETPGLKQWMVKRAWSLEIGVEKLFGLTFSYEITILSFSFLAPVQAVLSKFGIKAGAIVFGIDIGFGLAGTVERSEYGKWGIKKVDVPFSTKVSIRLFLQLSSVAECGIETDGEYKAEFDLKKNAQDKICIHAPKRDVIITISFYANVDIGIWSGSVHHDIAVWDIPQDESFWPL